MRAGVVGVAGCRCHCGGRCSLFGKSEMASTTAKILRGLVTGILVFAFFSGGVVKLTDKVSSKVHKEMVNIW